MVTQPSYDPEFHPQDLIRRMALGETDADIMAAWGISTTTFWQNWPNEHPDFREAMQIGYPHWEKKWLQEGKVQALEGNGAYHKYWASVMAAKASQAWRHAQKAENASNTTINVNVIDNKSTKDLLAYVANKMDKLKDLGIIDAEFKRIDDQSE